MALHGSSPSPSVVRHVDLLTSDVLQEHQGPVVIAVGPYEGAVPIVQRGHKAQEQQEEHHRPTPGFMVQKEAIYRGLECKNYMLDAPFSCCNAAF